MLDTLRFRVAVRFLEIYPKDGAELSLKNASTRFEKSKKMQFIVKDQRPNDGHKEVVKGLVQNIFTYYYIMIYLQLSIYISSSYPKFLNIPKHCYN